LERDETFGAFSPPLQARVLALEMSALTRKRVILDVLPTGS
jgi:hypothetical protein